jgi:DNA-binding response OmpR family regulator
MGADQLDNEKAQPLLEPQRILIADDDPTTRMMLRAAVTQWGYEVTEAGDGEEAWEILKHSDAPRLLILDWMMPKLDGVELCSRIRAELKFHHYIILLTQLAGAANLIRGLEAGADEFLSKPFNMAELCSRLSVGTRILNFENKIDAHNRQLEAYLSQLIKLSTTMLTNSHSINEIAKNNSLEEKKTELIGKLDELHEELERGSKVIKRLQQIIKA